MSPRRAPRVCTAHDDLVHDVAFSCRDAEMDAAEDRHREWLP